MSEVLLMAICQYSMFTLFSNSCFFSSASIIVCTNSCHGFSYELPPTDLLYIQALHNGLERVFRQCALLPEASELSFLYLPSDVSNMM